MHAGDKIDRSYVSRTNMLIDAVNADREQWEVVTQLKPGKTMAVDRRNRFRLINDPDPKIEAIVTLVQGLNENTFTHIRELQAAVVQETDPFLRQLGLAALERLNVQIQTADGSLNDLQLRKIQGIIELEQKKAEISSRAHELEAGIPGQKDESIKNKDTNALQKLIRELKETQNEIDEAEERQLLATEQLTAIRSVIKHIADYEIANARREIRALLDSSTSTTSAAASAATAAAAAATATSAAIAISGRDRTQALFEKMQVRAPHLAFESMHGIKRYSTDASAASTKQVNELINGVANDITPVDLIGPGSPKVPYQFQRDIRRTALLKLNGEVVAQTNVTKDEDFIKCYQKICSAAGGPTAGFRLASFLVQTAFTDLTEIAMPYFLERELSISAITGMYIDVQTTDTHVFITIKGCFTGRDPNEINLNPGTFLVKRMIAVPLSELQKMPAPGESLVINGIQGTNFISDPIVSKQIASSLLEQF